MNVATVVEGPTDRLVSDRVKRQHAGADTMTVARNEILTQTNNPETYMLAIAEVETQEPPYIRKPSNKVTGLWCDVCELRCEEIIETQSGA